MRRAVGGCALVPAAHAVVATVVFVDRGIYVFAFLQSLYEFKLVLANSTALTPAEKLKSYFDGIILEIEISLS